MLFEFIAENRAELIARTRAKVAARLAPRATEEELLTGVPRVLDQLVLALQRRPEQTPDSGARSAAAHGAALLQRGYTVAQVVYDFGDICQAITELADERGAAITTEEFQLLNLALDNGIAEAVTEYSRVRDQTVSEGETERLGVFAHELRNRLSVVQLAFVAIKSGRAPIGGSVAAVLLRNINDMTGLINRALLEVRLESGHARKQRTHLRQILEDAGVDGTMEAGARGVALSVVPGEDIDVDVDPLILAGAVANLLQNAFKFTPTGGSVSLTSEVDHGRVRIHVADQCGGLPVGKAAQLFGAFEQHGEDRSGLGLGLYISKQGVEASGGRISVRDLPGTGCVFTIEFPVLPLAS